MGSLLSGRPLGGGRRDYASLCKRLVSTTDFSFRFAAKREMVVIDSEKTAWRRGQTENVSREKLSLPHQDDMWGMQNVVSFASLRFFTRGRAHVIDTQPNFN